MKKIICIFIALLLSLSLTACGGSGDGEGTSNKPSLFKPTLTKYINEDALGNTDNITISLKKVENENKGCLVYNSVNDVLTFILKNNYITDFYVFKLDIAVHKNHIACI